MVITDQVLSKLRKHPVLNENQLKIEFSRLLMNIRRILSQSVDSKNNLETCKEFCIHLKNTDDPNKPLFSAETKLEIDRCMDFKHFFLILNQYIRWDEHSILMKFLKACSSEEATEEFLKYRRKVILSNALQIININSKSDPPPSFEKFCATIDKPYRKFTVEKYEEAKEFIIKNLDTNLYLSNEYIRALTIDIFMN